MRLSASQGALSNLGRECESKQNFSCTPRVAVDDDPLTNNMGSKDEIDSELINKMVTTGTGSANSRPRHLSINEIISEENDLLPLDRFSHWVHAIAIITFDM